MKLAIILIGLISLNACQTVMEVQSASQKGVVNSYSCEQITTTFTAYKRDKTALSPLLDIAKMTGLTINQSASGFNPSQYYTAAKTSANVALIAQGCKPL